MEHSQYVAVAASQTTAQVSRINDGTANRDYLHQLIVVPASSAVGAVTVFDGTTALVSIPALAGGDSKPYTLPIGVVCTSTKGFNITTGSSVAVVAVGRFFV
jgi:hypothetical protein